MKLTTEKQVQKPLPSFCICHTAGTNCFHIPENKELQLEISNHGETSK
jgi:hypothetical protein